MRRQCSARAMWLQVLVATLLSLLLSPSFGVAEEKQPASKDVLTGEKIFDKYVEVTGGMKAYDKIKNRYIAGSVEIAAQGLKLAVTSYAAKPDKLYMVMKSKEIGDIERGADGKVIWEKSAMSGQRILEGGELAEAARDAAFDLYAYWRKQYGRAELIGSDSVDGSFCYKVAMTPKVGKPQTFYFDQKSNLLLKIESIVEHQMGALPAEVLLSDYRKVDGIMMPYHTRETAMGMTMIMTVDSVRQNIELPKGVFDIPADIQALMQKK